MICSCDSFHEEVRIALVGKYVQIPDAYASLNKALRHSAIHAKRQLVISVDLCLNYFSSLLLKKTLTALKYQLFTFILKLLITKLFSIHSLSFS